MKKLILLLILFISTFSFSQSQTRDVVYLKNGSIIKGTITEMNPSENLKIKTGDGSLFVYKMSEILKMEKEEFSSPNVNTNNNINNNNINNNVEGLSESKAKEVINALFTNKDLSESIKVVGVSEWSSELRKESSEFRFIAGKVKLNVLNYGKWKVQHASTTFKFKRIDGEWYIKDISANFSGYGYVPYGRWVRGIYEKVSEVKTKSQIKATTQNNIKKLENAGDYKQADISELVLKPIYLKADNVPLFENSSNRFSVKKLPKNCNECRNDNITSIENTVNKAVQSTNRYSSINEDDFKSSSNNAKFTIYVSQITNKHKGVKENGADKGFSCSIKYGVSLRANFTSPQEITVKDTKSNTATSSIWKVYSNKESAFNGALIELENQIKQLIFRYEPLALSVKAIELDEKGNPEYLVLNEANNLFDKKKVNFYIIESSSLSVNNNKFSASNILGEVTYKKSDFPNEIKMKIKKSKLKKALKEYIGKESELIGMSNSK
ncbi:hypothetical protein [Tenacibaculum sp. 1_MG-2023]|uniref:hypothetical protein n=1 Tax=Tenacibaculum sp. 1_MG-2023 TaxID=3062653 RepID=UPI0026E35497|nr:hypothetical protein [Tenacibaculum sp. 1_MG-2023]MDO6599890.1 hypothetical protein [Tenacibaculum sp. 1_MG-2023]